MRQILGGYKGRRIELEAEKEGGLKYLQTIEQNSDGSFSSAQNRPTELARVVKQQRCARFLNRLRETYELLRL